MIKKINIKRILTYYSIILLISIINSNAWSQQHSYVPKQGFVPNKEIAIQIAVLVLKPIYGERHINEQKPFKAVLRGGAWIVTGTLPKRFDVGGVAEITISKKTAAILRVTHGK